MGYTYYKPVTIDHDKIDAALANFPVLFKSTINELKSVGNGGHVQSSDGFDIIFSSDKYGGVTLPHEIIHYDETTGEFIAHVTIPAISASVDTVYYMLYGNSAISTSQEDITGVWDANFMSVWHLYQPSGDYVDSTSNSRELDNITTTSRTAAGKIYQCPQLDGTNDEMYGSFDAYTLANLTCEAIVKADDHTNVAECISQGINPSGYITYEHRQEGGKIWFGRYLSWAAQGILWLHPTELIADDTWYYTAATHVNESEDADIWVGDAKETITDPDIWAAGSYTTNVTTGYVSHQGGAVNSWEGNIEEVRVSNTVRSDSWIKATCYTLTDPATFYAVGDEDITRIPRHPVIAMPLPVV